MADTTQTPPTNEASASRQLAEALSSGAPLTQQLAVSAREGNELTEQGLGADLRQMSYGQLVAKYGEEVANQRGNIVAEGRAQNRALDKGRSATEILSDTALSGAASFVGMVGSVEAAVLGGAGAVDQAFNEENTGLSEMAVGVAEYTDEWTDYIRSFQSETLQDRQEISNIEGQLDTADSLAKYEQDIASGNSQFVAGLSRMGRDAMNTGGRILSDKAILGDTVAQALGSLGPSAKLAQAGSRVATSATNRFTRNEFAEKLARAAGDVAPISNGQRIAGLIGVSAGVGAGEASGAYMDTVNAVMSRDHTEMLTSPEYVAMVDAGIDPVQAQELVASSTALEAFGRQFPTAMAVTLATGAGAFNATPIATIRRGNMVDGFAEVGKQALEEGVQGASAQFNQNVAVRNQVDADQRLTDGLGEQFATGAIAGAGMARGVMMLDNVQQTLEVANKVGLGTADAVKAGTNVASNAIKAGATAAGTVSNKVQQTVNNVQTRPTGDLGPVGNTLAGAVMGAKQATNVIKTATAPVLSRIQDIAESSNLGIQVRNSATAKAVQIQAQELVTKTADASKGMIKIAKDTATSAVPTEFADSVPSGSTVVEAVAGMMQSFAQPNLNVSKLSESAVLFAAENFAALKSASTDLPAEIKTGVSKIISSSDFKKVKDLASKIDLNKTQTAETEINENTVGDTVRVAKINPTNVNPDFVNKILEQPKGTVSDEDIHLLKAAAKVAAAVNNHEGQQVTIHNDTKVSLSKKPAYQANPSKVDDARIVKKLAETSRSVQVAGFAGARSVNDYAADIFTGAQSEDGSFVNDEGFSVPVGSVAQEFKMFAEHMSNKVAALRQSIEGNENGKGPSVPFRSLSLRGRKMVDAGQAGAAKAVFVHVNSPESVALAKVVENDARVTAEVYNTMVEAFPDLFPEGPIEVPSLSLETQENASETSQEEATETDAEGPADTETTEGTPESDDSTTGEEGSRDEASQVEEDTTAVESQEEQSDAPAEDVADETTTVEEDAAVEELVSEEVIYDLPEIFQNTFAPAGNTLSYTDGVSLVDQVENSEFKRITKALLRPLSVRMNQRLKTTEWTKGGPTIAEAIQDPNIDVTAVRKGKVTMFVNPETLKYDEKLLSLASVALVDWMSSARSADPSQLEDTLEDLGVNFSDLTEEDIHNIHYGVSPRQVAETVARNTMKLWDLEANPDAPMIDTRGAVEGLVKELITVSADMGLFEILEIPVKDGHTADTIVIKKLKRMQDAIGLEGQNSIQKLLAAEDASAPSIGEKLGTTDQTQSRGKVKLSEREKKALKRMQDTPHFISEGVSGFVQALGFPVLNEMLGYRDTSELGQQHPLRASIAGKNLSIERDYADAMAVVDAINGKNSDEKVPVYYPVGISKVGRHQFKGINPQNNKILRAMVTPTHSTLDMTNKADRDAFWLTVAQAADLFKVENEAHSEILAQVEDSFNDKFGSATEMAQKWIETGEVDSAAFGEAMGSAGMAELAAVIAVAQLNHAKANGTEASFETTLSFELDGKTDGPANMMSNFGQGLVSALDYLNFKRVGFFIGKVDMTLNKFFPTEEGKRSGDLYEGTSIAALKAMNAAIAKAKPEDKAAMIATTNFSVAFGDLRMKDGQLEMTRTTAKSPVTKTVYGSGVRGVASGIAQDMVIEFYEKMLTVPAGQKAKDFLGYPTLEQDFKTLFGFDFPNDANWNTDYMEASDVKKFEDIVTKGLGEVLSSTTKSIIGDKITNVNDSLVFLTGVQTTFLQKLFDRELKALAEKRAAAGTIGRNKNGEAIISQLSQRDYNGLVAKLRAYAPTYSNGTQTLAVGSFTNEDSNQFLSSTLDEKLRMSATMAAPTLAGVKIIPYLSIGRGDAMMMNTIYSADNAPTDTLPVFDGIDMPVSRVKDYANQINEAVMQNWDRDVLADVEADFETFLNSVGSDTDLLAEAFEEASQSGKKERVAKGDGSYEMVAMNQLIASSPQGLLEVVKEQHRQNQARKAAFKKIPLSVDHMGGSDTAYTRGEGEMTLEEINTLIQQELDGEVVGVTEDVDTPDVGLDDTTNRDAVEGEFSSLTVADVSTMVDAMLSEIKDSGLRSVLKGLRKQVPSDAKVVTGSLAEVTKYREDMYGSDGQTLTDSNGLYDVENNVIFLIENNHETMVHELVHMVTFGAVLTHYENGEKNAAVSRLEALMDEFISLDMSKESDAVRTAANQAMRSILTNQNTDTPMAKAVALNEFMAWSLSNRDLIAKLKNTKTKTLTEKVMRLIFSVLKISAPKDMFGNILFNATIVNGIPQQEATPEVEADNSDGEVTQSAHKYTNFWLDRVRDMLKDSLDADGTGKNERVVRYGQTAHKLVRDLDFGGFNMSEYQKQTFMAIHTVLAAEMRLDPQSLIAMNKLFSHVTANLSPSMFGDVMAEERFQTVMDMFGNTKNDDGVTDAVAVLLALSQTSNGFRNALEQLPEPEAGQIQDGSVNSFLEVMTATLMNKAVGSIDIADKSAVDVLDGLSRSIIRQDGDREYFGLKTAMSSIKKANEITVGAMDKLAGRTAKLNQDVLDSDRSDAVKLAVGTVTLATSFLSESRSKDALLGFKNGLHMGQKLPALQFINEFVTEVVGTDKVNAGVVALLDRVNSAVSSARQAFREDLPNILANEFQTAPTAAQWKTMHRVLGKTDFAALFDLNNPEASIRLIASESRLDKKIEQAEKAINANFSPATAGVILEKTQQLANFMGGNGAGHQLWKNAYAINKMAGEYQANMTAEIDQLVSMYALQGMDSAAKKEIVDLYNADPDGVSNLVVYTQSLNRQEEMKVEAGFVTEAARMNGYKGYIPDQGSGGSRLIIEDDANEDALIAKGYVKVQPYRGEADMSSNSLSYYATTVKQGGMYSQGVIQNAQASYRGVDADTGQTSNGSVSGVIKGDAVEVLTEELNIKGYVDDAKEVLMPVYDNDGYVVAYERAINPDLAEAYLAPKSNLALMLGAWAGRLVEEQQSREYNKALVASLKKIYDSRDVKSDGLFVDLSSSKDPILQDSWRVIPQQTKDYIEEVFGEDGGFMVRKDMVNLAVGYREASITDIWTGKTRMPKAAQTVAKAMLKTVFRGKALPWLSNMEEGAQGVVSAAKDIIVVKSLVVPFMNAQANAIQLMTRGVGVKEAINGTRDKLAEIEQYNENSKEIIKLNARIELAGTDKNRVAVLQQQRSAIVDQNKRMSIAPMIEAGAYKNISEGITDMDVEITSGRLADYIENQVNKLPGALKTAAKYAMISKDTPIYKGANKAVQYGDFIAKSVYYDHLLNEGLTAQQAVEKVNEEFVNFSTLPGRTRSYMESMGGSWFLTFKIRSMKIALNTIQKNPVGALITGGAFDAGSPIEDNLLSVIAEDRLDYSLGLDMLLGSPDLNPWMNLIDTIGE